jgi:hypothetical protein
MSSLSVSWFLNFHSLPTSAIDRLEAYPTTSLTVACGLPLNEHVPPSGQDDVDVNQ